MNEIIIVFSIIVAFIVGLLAGWQDRRELRKSVKLSDYLVKQYKGDIKALRDQNILLHSRLLDNQNGRR